MKTRLALSVASVGVIAASLTACGSSGSSGSAASSSSPMASSSMSSSMSSPMTSSAMSSGAADASAPFGSGCSAVPASGKGSFNGMQQDPVATAASNNPVLSTLVTAVKKAGLVDTLNSAPALTVFAPANSAFAKIPASQLNAVLANKAELTKLLTGHVISGRLTPSELAGSHKSLAGTTVTVTGSGSTFMVDGTANVICGNVQTSNATVYIIDSVLMAK